MTRPDLLDRLSAGARGYVLIALLALSAALPGVFAMPPLDRDESRFAQATTQMLETGDYVRIRFQDVARNKKPAGIHWLQAASVSLFSSDEARTIWAYRLPSVLGAVIAALAAFWAGTALMPRRSAFVGAALFAVCIMLGIEGMIAKTDGMLAGTTTLALAALMQLRQGPSRQAALVFWAAMGVSVLIKGPVGPLVALLTVLALTIGERRTAWLRPLAFWPGPLMFLAIGLPWFIAVQIATNGTFISEAVNGDLAPKLGGGQEGHGAPPGYHLALVSVLLFPASLFLLPALARTMLMVRDKREAAPDDTKPAVDAARALLAWAIPSFLFFELLPTKLAHYTLPAYPALALLVGGALTGFFPRREPVALEWISRGLFCLVGGALFVLLGEVGFTLNTALAPLATNAKIVLFLVGFTASALAAFGYRHNVAAAVASVVLIALSWHVAGKQILLPQAEQALVSPRLSKALVAHKLHPRLSPGTPGPLVTFGYSEPSLVFLTRTDTEVDTFDEAVARATLGAGAIVAETSFDAFNEALRPRGLVLVEKARLSGINYSRDGADVTLIVAAVSSISPPLS